MKQNYLIEAFHKTTARDFPAQKAQLNAAMEKRLGDDCCDFCLKLKQ